MAVDAHDSALLRQFLDPRTKEAGFTAIVTKYQERLYRHIRRLVITHDDANDVLQNVFIKMWRGLDSFQMQAQLYTWLYRIATNECISFLEKKRRKDTVSLEHEKAVASMRADSYFNPDKLEWKLQMAILQLPEKQRIVFNLRYFDEMPYQEMSRILETSEGALKASYYHAVKKIEEYLLSH